MALARSITSFSGWRQTKSSAYPIDVRLVRFLRLSRRQGAIYKTLNALLRKQGAIDFPSEEIIRTALPSTVLQTLITKYLRPVSITSG